MRWQWQCVWGGSGGRNAGRQLLDPGDSRRGDEALEFLEPLLDLVRRHPSTRTTTRRFFARPSRLSLEATGWSSP